MLVLFFWTNLVFCMILSTELANSADDLELVHVIFRHGDRTPEKVHLYPTDPNLNATWMTDFGKLTKAGKEKVKLLGKLLKRRYGTFLGNYTNKKVFAQSTNMDRTKLSLQIVLNEIFNKTGQFREFPIVYKNLSQDHMLSQTYKYCPRYRKLYYEYLNTSEALNLTEKYTETRNYIKTHFQLDPSLINIWSVFFTLQMEQENNMTIPTWIYKVYPKPMDQLVWLEYHARSATETLKRLSSGFLFKKMIKDTRKKIKHQLSNNPKMFMYSAHDFTIAYLLQFLGIYYNHVPPYAAAIIIEIHNINSTRIVKVFYQNYETKRPRRMKIPNCHIFCKFRRFVKLHKKMIPKDTKECFLD